MNEKKSRGLMDFFNFFEISSISIGCCSFSFKSKQREYLRVPSFFRVLENIGDTGDVRTVLQQKTYLPQRGGGYGPVEKLASSRIVQILPLLHPKAGQRPVSGLGLVQGKG